MRDPKGLSLLMSIEAEKLLRAKDHEELAQMFKERIDFSEYDISSEQRNSLEVARLSSYVLAMQAITFAEISALKRTRQKVSDGRPK